MVHRAALEGTRQATRPPTTPRWPAVREAARLIAEDERLTPVLVPLGDGLLIAARLHRTGLADVFGLNGRFLGDVRSGCAAPATTIPPAA